MNLIEKIKQTMNFVDLSVELNASSPSWHGECGFKLRTNLDYEDCTSSAKFRVQSIQMDAGMGTHLDAPAHCFEGAVTVDKILLEDLLFIPLHVINVTAKVEQNDDYVINQADVFEYEKHHGKISEKSLVVFCTGWDKYSHDAVRFRNADANGIMHFPTVGVDAIDYLLTKNIIGIWVDTLGPDGNADGDFVVHQKVLGAGKYIVERLANLEAVPASGAYAIILVPRIQGATESPSRVIAIF